MIVHFLLNCRTSILVFIYGGIYVFLSWKYVNIEYFVVITKKVD